jgi:pimeloyl-ACP methyl ester carboxylesterase
MQKEQRIQFLTAPQGNRIAYSTVGAGPALVRTPPWLSHLDGEWQTPPIRRFYESIAERHCVVRYDSLGCGLSDWTRNEFSVASELATLERLVDHLELERFALFGYDAGGPVAIAYAARHPARISNLILFGTFASADHLEAAHAIPGELQALMVNHWEWASRLVADLHAPDADGATLQMIAAMYRQASTGANVIRATQGFIYDTDVLDLLPTLQIPTTVIHRIKDLAFPYQAGRELAARIPQGCFVPLAGSSHLPYLGDSAAVLSAIARALGDEDRQNFGIEHDSKICASCGAHDGAQAASGSSARAGDAITNGIGGHDDREDSELSGPDGLGLTTAASGVGDFSPSRSARFCCEGEYWTLAYTGETLRVKDSRGMRYLAQLLRYPGREFHATELEMRSEAGAEVSFAPRAAARISEEELSAAGLHSDSSGDAGEMLDARAKGAYRRRLQELRGFLDEAKGQGNVERAFELEEEISFLTRELSRAVGLGGRDRRAASVAQRSRLNVTRAIRRSIEKIRQHHPALGAHLATRVKTGLQCVYREEGRSAMQWEL